MSTKRATNKNVPTANYFETDFSNDMYPLFGCIGVCLYVFIRTCVGLSMFANKYWTSKLHKILTKEDS